ncbi:hypothetical protein EDD16DRAFT_1634889 [Pisolithus croceorrhizus]|nr:hypothetical protein EDD16DRAFT_1634889 [Pisolithus croceorrhizus]
MMIVSNFCLMLYTLSGPPAASKANFLSTMLFWLLPAPSSTSYSMFRTHECTSQACPTETSHNGQDMHSPHRYTYY